MKETSIAGLVLCSIGAVSLIFRSSVLANTSVAISVQVMACLLLLWGRLTLGRRGFHVSAEPTEGGLINTGPYRYLRHPMYTSLLYFFWAGLFCHLSIINFGFVLAVTTGLFIRMWVEEHLVAQKYPEYKIYAKKAKMIIPFII
jgi:protein-S-isoprenylcysteine O-methyltransferase Ste14